MISFSTKPVRTACYLALIMLATSCPAFAQDQSSGQPPQQPPQEKAPARKGEWRQFSGPTPNRIPPSSNSNNQSSQNDPQNQGPDPNQQNDPPNSQPNSQPNYIVPSQLTVKPGTFVTVWVNQTLSSDRNQAGDAFTATLAKPLVVDGVVVAQRGQTVGGRVAEARKAGRVEGVSRLSLQLTDLTLVDGQVVPLDAQLINRRGPTSEGRDAGAIVGTTILGAAIGGAARGGQGAAIGAGAGVVAATIGVLVTRGRPTVIYPESVLTFRILAPITISTARAPQAFRYVDPSDYDQPAPVQNSPPPRTPPPPYSYYYGYYGPSYYPYYYAPGFSFFYGPRFFVGHRSFHRFRR
jgi:hypothetical protein